MSIGVCCFFGVVLLVFGVYRVSLWDLSMAKVFPGFLWDFFWSPGIFPGLA